jgi:hypothetical protein
MAARQAITLGEANDTWLDTTFPEPARLYRNGMKCLEGEKYDGKSKGLRVFLESFKAKAIMYNWFDVLTVPDAAGTLRNFLNSYGTITMAECQAHATIYMAARDRAAQNSQMIYHCVVDSITTEVQATLMAEQEHYEIDGYSDGLCFLKMLISKAQVNTIGTINMLRTAISSLPNKMVELSGNVIEFNNYVRNIEHTMLSYNESSKEIMVNLFMSYSKVEDEDFVTYVKNKRNAWEEETIVLTTKTLMTFTDNHYKTRIQQEDWLAPTKKDEQIIALTAALAKTTSKSGRNAAVNKVPGAVAAVGTVRLPKSERLAADKINNPWKYARPQEGESTTILRDGATWHWCTKHNRYTGHTDADCQGVGTFNPRRAGTNNNVAYVATGDDNSTAESTITTPTVQVNRALLSIMNDNGSLFD